MKKTIISLASLIVLVLFAFNSCNQDNIVSDNGKFNSKLNATISVPSNLYYTASHEWIDINFIEETARIGITEYATDNETGEVDGIVIDMDNKEWTGLPDEDTVITIKGKKGKKKVIAPLTGWRDSNNEDVLLDPSLISTDPYGDGWLVKMNNVDVSDLTYLMTAAEYQTYINGL